MNYAPRYPAPNIVTQPPGRYYDDESSPPSSASAYRKHRTQYDNSSPVTSVEQSAGRRSRSRTRRRHRRTSEPHHHHSRSMSRDESPTRLPRGYKPASPDRYSHDGDRSREFSPVLLPTQYIPQGNSPPGGSSYPRTQPPTMAGSLYSTVPPQSATWPKHVHHSNRHRSSSHSHPDGYSSSRPPYTHRRSRSYDGALSRSPQNAYPPPQQGYGGHAPAPLNQPFQTQTAAYPASGYPASNMGSGVGAVQPPYSSPFNMQPPAHTTTIVPLNDGKDGWVVVPPQGQSISVASAQRAKAAGHKNRDRHSPSTGSFFSRFLNFGKSPKKSKFVVPQQPTMVQPVQYTNPRPHRSRKRRDSY